MKIYFAGSIRGGRQDKELYSQIIKILSGRGVVLTEHVGDYNISDRGEDEPEDALIYKRDMEWLEKADVVVAEVSIPSIGVGYEIGKAENLNKPIICLYRSGSGKRLSAMISGNQNLETRVYNTIEEAEEIINKFLSNL